MAARKGLPRASEMFSGLSLLKYNNNAVLSELGVLQAQELKAWLIETDFVAQQKIDVCFCVL